MTNLTVDMMRRRWPQADKSAPGLIEGIVTAAPNVFAQFNLTSPLVIAHLMAQVSEECGEGTEMEENMNYSAARLLEVFPSHFTRYTANIWQHQPRMIADFAYGGRMGNAKYPSDDGYNFRGHGLTQVTGRIGHEQLQVVLKLHGLVLDVMNHPELVCDPRYALMCGVADFYICGCIPRAERDDVRGVTLKLNGGTNGLAERERQLALWKHELNV